MIYQWKNGAHVQLDPQLAGTELERIRVRHNGRLEPEVVIAESRSETAPLHPHFEWEDQRAAQMWRIDQAKYLIRSIEVRIEQPGKTDTVTRAFVSVERERDRSYTSIVHALSDDALRAQVLERAWQELEAWRKRHAELVELAGVFAAIGQARAA